MTTFTIQSSDSCASIEFFDREPPYPAMAIDYFKVRLRDVNLDATARIYLDMSEDLAGFFTLIARNWSAFTGPKQWSSFEGDFSLVITHDGRGHFLIKAELKSGLCPRDWTVHSSIMIDTSQLDRLAADLAEFIGKQPVGYASA
jgi:hypothetical protein